METARSDVRAAYSALGNVSNDLKSTTWLVRTHRHPQHCGHHPPPCGYSDKPRFSAASFPGCLATCLFGHTVDVLQEAGEVKTGVALPNPKRILVAPATARLQVWAYEVFLDFFRVYFCTTVLARAIRFGFGSATTQVVPRLERERERERKNADWSWPVEHFPAFVHFVEKNKLLTLLRMVRMRVVNLLLFPVQCPSEL